MLSKKHDLKLICLESNHNPGYMHRGFMVLLSPARTPYLKLVLLNTVVYMLAYGHVLEYG